MTDFFEIDSEKKTIKKLNLEDFSIEDLIKHMREIEEEISRVKTEISKKKNIQKDAEKFFK